jgi:hypothetical protein
LGDPVDVTTNVTYYPEIPDLAKLDATKSPRHPTLKPIWKPSAIDPVATHAGENVSFVQTNYNDSAWRLLNLPHDWVVELPFNSGADGGHGFKSGQSVDQPVRTPLAGIGTRSPCPPSYSRPGAVAGI